MTQVITETALREFISEALDTPEVHEELQSSKEADLPCVVNPSMDSSLVTVELSPVDVQFVPHNQVEFGIAIKQMAKNLPDEVIPMLYAKVREVMMDAQEKAGPLDQGDTTEMEKRDHSRLGMEGVRKVIRKMIAEMNVGSSFNENETDDASKKKDDLKDQKRKMNLAGGIENDFPDEDFEVNPGRVWDEEAWDEPSEEEDAEVLAHRAMVDKEEDEEEFGEDPFDTSDVDAETSSEWDPTPVAATPKKANRKESETGYGVEGDQLRRIAAELGISASGAKRLLTVGLGKLAYMHDLGPEQVKDVVHGAARDWVEMLVDKGRIDDAEGRTWLRHLDVVAQNDEFRDFLHSYIRDEMKKDDEWVFDKSSDKDEV